MDRSIERVDESRIGIGREIHYQPRPRRDCAGYFDVENHFAVGAVRIAGRRVVRATDRDSYDARRLHAKLREILFEIHGAISAAELEDGDGLSAAIRALGKVV